MAFHQDPLLGGEPVDEDEEENDRSYEAYERQYGDEHSWDQLQEENGRLRPLDDTAELRARRARILAATRSARIRKGMIRYMLLVVDLSRAASGLDLRPNRLAVMIGAAKSFIRAYFHHNPLSYLSVLVMRDGVAVKLTELGGSPERQIQELSALMDTSGDASLQNALELCLEALAVVPPYGAKQVVMLVAALASVDPSDVFASIRKAKEAKVTVSIVGVSAEVHVLRKATQETGGTYSVALNEQHLQELMLAHAPPPPTTSGQLMADLVRMGFPPKAPEDPSAAVFVGELSELLPGSYACPRCKACVQELPCRCHVCGLTLVSSPHLARSYHHLFPVDPYEEVSEQQLEQLAAGGGPEDPRSSSGGGNSIPNGNHAAGQAGAHAAAATGAGSGGDSRRLTPPWQEDAVSTAAAGEGTSGGEGGTAAAAAGGEGACGISKLLCYGCLKVVYHSESSLEDGDGLPAASLVLRCTTCRQLFCFDCDVFVHETLHNCPGCECLQQQQQQQQQQQVLQ